jgi:hypothetical protein
MKNGKHPHVDLGLLAMPLFCSLLGAILILIFTNASGNPSPLSREKIKELLARLSQTQQAISQSITTQNVISNRLDLAEYQAANAKLDEQIAEKLGQVAKLTNQVSQAQILQGRLEELRRQADTTASDVAEAKARLTDLEARVTAAATNAAIGLFGSYRGSLVMIECDGNGAIVHPGGRKLALDAPERELDPVFTDIARAGFVAIVARPGGFTKSYGRINRIVDERLQEMNKQRTTPIGICAFPLDAGAPITAFLPKGVSQ